RPMFTHFKAAVAIVLAWQATTVALGQEAEEQDARVQQYAERLQPTLWKELEFVRQVCSNLKPELRPKVKAVGEAAVKQAAKSMGAFRQGQREVDKVSAVQAIRNALAQNLKESLSADEFAHYSEEMATRVSANRQATIMSVIGQLDGVLYLSQEQREKIS